ncbi:MAG: acyl-CoA dehydrogenase [Deltaproteobacteria bacterium]|jgi:butyryl-CoA dehydrogenase|nr:acyl-CoA dehydrogenase [Deltaproteobacteria bacterium]
MASKFAGRRNLDFLLYEVHDVQRLFSLPYYEEHSRETCDLAIDTAMKLAKNLLYPYLREMDEKEPVLEEGQVKVHPIVKTMMKEWGEGGWLSSALPFEADGQQLPVIVHMACNFLFAAANFSATGYSLLTAGAAHLILSHGTGDMKKMYIPRMVAGEWQGTMAMTEPQAGSSLSDITTRATPTDQGYYKIRGQKIFISAGDHDGVENIVHMMLAKIEGGPPGVKGISLFLVPKKRPGAGGSLEPNDVTVSAVYHKLGYRGCPITQLSIGDNDDCRGYLVGEPHKGLSYMFQMMNEARIGVGMQATGIASAAYYASLEYAAQRLQGRRLSTKDPVLPQVPIIEHADIRRMLLFQRAITEGSLSVILQSAIYADLVKASDGEDRERYELLLDLLTPVAKSYPSENGIMSVSQGLQILGGYGYCREFPLEQYYRDIRIHPIHEGTTTIQAMDLLGRKVVMKNGKALELFFEEVRGTIQAAAAFEELMPYCERLEEALEKCRVVTMHRLQFAMRGDLEKFLADATLYLELFGTVAVAWQWLAQGLAACRGLTGDCSDVNRRFYEGKLHTMRYFFHYEAPKIHGPASRLMESDGLTVEMNHSIFDD